MKLFRTIILFTLLIGFTIPAIPQFFYKNSGVSTSTGTVSMGQLKNAYKLSYKGDNYKFYSRFVYYVLGRSYLHSTVHKIVNETYKQLAKQNKGYTYRIMDCSSKKGGKLFPHHTHQNGTSIDFMTPLLKKGKSYTFFDKIGILRYALEFDTQGKCTLNKNIQIDFNAVAQHIIMLDKIAQKNSYRIKKVILETNLKDELFATRYGSELKRRNIYFVKSLPRSINRLHDDHYHIDFVKR